MSKAANRKRGRRNREKGQEGEREIVHMAQAAGLYAERSWRAAQSRDENVRSIDVVIEGEPFQVKLVSKGFKGLFEALAGVSGFFIREPKKEWVVVIPARQYFALLKRSLRKHAATTLQRVQLDSLDLGPKRPYRRNKKD
jgi:hypothetical protein